MKDINLMLITTFCNVAKVVLVKIYFADAYFHSHERQKELLCIVKWFSHTLSIKYLESLRFTRTFLTCFQMSTNENV